MKTLTIAVFLVVVLLVSGGCRCLGGAWQPGGMLDAVPTCAQCSCDEPHAAMIE